MSGSLLARSVAAVTGGSLIAVALVVPPAHAVVEPTAAVIINEVFGGGGSTGAPFTHDYIELLNVSDDPVDLSTWSVQYSSAAGTNWSGVVPLVGTIAPGAHYVIQGASNAAVGAPLPGTPAVSAASLNLSASSGNVALVADPTKLTCATTACAGDPVVVDLLGFGSGAAFAGSAPAPAGSGTTSASRKVVDGVVQNTAQNADDFVASATLTPGSANPAYVPPPPAVVKTIAEIQGTGATSPLVGVPVIAQGVVTASYTSGGLNGFVIQTPGPDTTPGASDAVFVYLGANATQSIGDHVAVEGTVSEFGGLTQITASADDVEIDPYGTGAAEVFSGSWPTTDVEREALESMLFLPTGPMTATNTYSTHQYGEVGLAAGTTPLRQPTDAAKPGTAEALAVAADNAARAVVLDDGASTNFLTSTSAPTYVSLQTPVRVGARATFTQPVVVDFRNNTWKLNPTAPVIAGAETVTFANTRTSAPDAKSLGDGDLTLASFNVLNYFTTLGADYVPACTSYKDRQGNPVTVNSCPGNGPRGAWGAADLQRQQEKIVAAINATDADVIGLMEIENSAVLGETPDEAVRTLVSALNTALGREVWAAVASSSDLPPVGEQDVITNAIIYRTTAVTPVGASVALGDLSGAGEPFVNAREPIGQVFQPKDGGDRFLLVVNHFKSKGSAGPLPGDADAGDGQGSSNASRIVQATAVRDWIPTVLAKAAAAGHSTRSVALVGDFNSYTQEDPLHVLYGAGYVNAKLALNGAGKYSYSYQGLSGSLDHVLMNEDMRKRATGVDVWSINAPESLGLEYSRYNAVNAVLHEATPFRSSDHDPVLVSFASGGVAPTQPVATATTLSAPATAVAGKPVTLAATVTPAAAGSVQFRSGATVLGTVATSATGTASLTITPVAGTLAVSAVFVPTNAAAHLGSTSAVVPITVTAAPVPVSPVSMSVKLSDAKIRYGATASVKVVVRGHQAAPSGKVELREGRTVLARGTLKVTGKTGTATIRVPKLKVGKHRLTVHYAGTATTAAYSASPRTLTVVKARSVATAKVSRSGKTVWVTVRATGSARATGKVVVRVDGKVVGTARLSGSTAKVKISKPRRGKHVFHVTYAGSSQVDGDTWAKRVRVR